MDEPRDPVLPETAPTDADEAPPRRDRLAHLLTATAVGSAIVWMVVRVVDQVAQAAGADPLRHVFSDPGFSAWDLLRVIDEVSYPVFVSSAGLFLVMWLDRRWREGR